jgi:hypothetical protein
MLAATELVRAHPRVTVRASAGQGAWARIPWIALLHADAATSTRAGVYVIYLFREDMSGLYLTLNQGVTEPIERLGSVVGITAVRTQAQDLRPRLRDLAAHGFDLEPALDLRSTFPAAQHYTASTIAHRVYALEAIPGDAELLADLQHAMHAYQRFVAKDAER